MKRILGILLLFICTFNPAFTQVISPDAARQELEKRGLEEEEVRARMLERGIDIDNIDPTNPAELMKAESALEEVIAEMEAEAKQKEQEEAQTKEKKDPKKEPEAKTTAKEKPDKKESEKPEMAEKPKEKPASQQPDSASIYGQHIFRNNTLNVFATAEDIRPSAAYVLGPGDEVNISIWGASQEEATYEINSEGYIKPSRMPRITLKGKTFKAAKELLRSRYAQYYNFRNEEFEVTITYTRAVTVNIFGEVFNPGNYTLPATNTAFNALVAAGGPTNIGSVRNIRLIRGGEPTRNIDVYEFMNDPSVREQFYLQDNDIIHVGTIGRIVQISGAVRRPFVFELSEGENLKKLMEYAGGFKDNAYQGNLQVKRFVDDAERIIDVNFRDLRNDFTLLSGDKVVVLEIPQTFQNFVEVDGAVELPGQFELNPGMKISDLVKKGKLLEEARQDIAFLLRTKADGTTGYQRVNLEEALQNPESASNITLQAKDRLRVLAQTKYVDQGTVTISGAVRNPGEQDLDTGGALKLDEAIILSGGLRPDATDFAYIYRVDPTNQKSREYIRVNLKNAMENPDSPDNITLQPLDQINVLSLLVFTDESFISVRGAIRKPGEYEFDESLNLRDVLTLAGGLKREAATSKVDISRVIIQDNQPTRTVVATVEVDRDLNSIGGDDFKLQPFDQIAVRTAPEFQLQQNITILGEITYPGRYALVDKNEKVWSLVQRAGGMTSEAFPPGATLYREKDDIGYVIMKLEEVEKNTSSRYNFILKDGDVIEIPKKKDLVTIQLDATQAAELYPDKLLEEGKLNVAFHEGKNAKWYIDKYAAGVGEPGKKSLISVEYPNGQIDHTTKGIFKKYPKVEKGSVIIVGRKPVEEVEKEKEKEDVDWGKVFADSITQATAILTLILLIQSLN